MSEYKESLNFIEQIVQEDLQVGKHANIVTRFPPEPNGYLHIGHSKSICLNFGIAQKFGGKTNLRFDDTNPSTEETEYVESIKKDVRWLGFEWSGEALYASDYFDELYDYAVQMVKEGKAYVDDSTAEEMAAMKGSPTSPGIESPYRNRSVKESLDLLERMKNGEFEEGTRVLRAKIDMTHTNMHMRDPIMYRIKKVAHHRTGTKWNIYPMYDYAHGLSDAIEGVTHSLCTLEFEVHRPLYDWFLEELDTFRSRQIEFARLNLTYTIMSKRKLLRLVQEGYVSGWDDPRMPTISGVRRRGFTPEAIRNFADRVGIARRENLIDVGLLEFFVREHLNLIAFRVMVVMEPLKVTLTNYPEEKTEWLTIENNPENEADGTRQVPFSRTFFIEGDDFMENPPKKYFRLFPGGSVRLKGAYIITCKEALKDANGKVTELLCEYVPNSKSGEDTSGMKVKGTIHWVEKTYALRAEIRLYDRLFIDENPAARKDVDFLDLLNPRSLEVNNQAALEPFLGTAKLEQKFQFMRVGYFCLDLDSTPEKLVFNRTVTLKDSWAKK